MALKPGAETLRIKEQIIEDKASGLTILIERTPAGSVRVQVIGDALPFGNRDFIFDDEGKLVGGGTATAGACKPSWLREVQSDG